MREMPIRKPRKLVIDDETLPWCVQDRRADGDAEVETYRRLDSYLERHRGALSATSASEPRTFACSPGMRCAMISWRAEYALFLPSVLANTHSSHYQLAVRVCVSSLELTNITAHLKKAKQNQEFRRAC